MTNGIRRGMHWGPTPGDEGRRDLATPGSPHREAAPRVLGLARQCCAMDVTLYTMPCSPTQAGACSPRSRARAWRRRSSTCRPASTRDCCGCEFKKKKKKSQYAIVRLIFLLSGGGPSAATRPPPGVTAPPSRSAIASAMGISTPTALARATRAGAVATPSANAPAGWFTFTQRHAKGKVA